MFIHMMSKIIIQHPHFVSWKAKSKLRLFEAVYDTAVFAPIPLYYIELELYQNVKAQLQKLYNIITLVHLCGMTLNLKEVRPRGF